MLLTWVGFMARILEELFVTKLCGTWLKCLMTEVRTGWNGIHLLNGIGCRPMQTLLGLAIGLYMTFIPVMSALLTDRIVLIRTGILTVWVVAATVVVVLVLRKGLRLSEPLG